MKQLIKAVLDKLGYRLVSTAMADPLPPLERFFGVIKGLGFAPRHIIDVGANHGNWTRSALKYFPDASYILIEPQEHLKPHVADLLSAHPSIQWINAGVGDTNGRMKFTLAARDDSSSFRLTSEQAAQAGLRQVDVEVLTLDRIVERTKGVIPNLVKIDAEGFDLKALAGAESLLGKTEVLLMEAAVCCQTFENTLLKSVMVMEQKGYMLCDITEFNRSPSQDILWLVELAFILKSSALRKQIVGYL